MAKPRKPRAKKTVAKKPKPTPIKSSANEEPVVEKAETSLPEIQSAQVSKPIEAVEKEVLPIKKQETLTAKLEAIKA